MRCTNDQSWQCASQPDYCRFGCGPIGVLCQKVSKVYGAKKAIGVEISQGRLDFARSYRAADDTFLPPKKPTSVETEMLWCEQLAKMIKEKFNLGEGPDVVIEATGNFVTKKGGTYVQAGMGREVITLSSLHLVLRARSLLTHFPDRGLSYHYSLYSGFHNSWIYSLHHWLLSCSRGTGYQWEN